VWAAAWGVAGPLPVQFVAVGKQVSRPPFLRQHGHETMSDWPAAVLESRESDQNHRRAHPLQCGLRRKHLQPQE
jgi:hypothetical protein